MMKLSRFELACAGGASMQHDRHASSAAGRVRANRFIRSLDGVPTWAFRDPRAEGNNHVFGLSRQMVEYPAPVLGSGKAVCLGLLTALALALPAAAQTGPKPLPAPKLPTSFLLTPTDQLGFPGQKAGTLVTPEGDLYTGWAEFTFNPGGTDTFDPRSHTLAQGRYPIVHLFKVVRGVLYELD